MDQLKNVQKVDAPPFLWTRIQAKIRKAETEKIPDSWKWAGTLAFCIVLFLNLFVYRETVHPRFQDSGKALAEGIRLKPDNQLYDE